MSSQSNATRCGQCATLLTPGLRFCPKCGAVAGAVTSVAASGSTVSGATASRVPPATRVLSGAIAATPPRPGGFWVRVAAFLIDLLVLVGPAYVAKVLVPIVGPLAVWWFYFALSESSSWQATVGKRIMRLKVTDVNVVPIRFGRASARFFARFLSTLPLGGGYVLAAFTENKQALHDFIASTRVVYR